MTHHEPESALMVETTSVEEFLRLLGGRESVKDSSTSVRILARRAVFVAPLQDMISDRYAFPKVTRRVVATFAYGADVVSYTRITSNAVELPGVARELAERHRETCEQLRVEIERGLEASGLCVPVHEGFLHHPTDDGHIRREEEG